TVGPKFGGHVHLARIEGLQAQPQREAAEAPVGGGVAHGHVGVVGGVAEADLRARGLGRQGGIPEEGARVEGVRRDGLTQRRGARVDGDLQELEAGCAGAVRAEVGNELGGGGRRECERTANEERKRRYQPEIRGRRSEVRTSTSNIGTPTSDIRLPTTACSSDAALSKTHTPPP